MHIAVDAHNVLTDRRGIGVYVRALLGEYVRRSDIRLTLLLREFWLSSQRNAIAKILGDTRFALANRVPHDADVVWSPWNGTFFPSRAPSVATIHDCAPFAYPNADARAREREQKPFVQSARNATHILTDSHFSAGEIRRHLGADPDRITVVPLGVDPAFAPGEIRYTPPHLDGRPYIVVVGADDARKNRATLVTAWRNLYPRAGVALVCVGGAAIPDAINLHEIDRETLIAIYRGARALAMPSTYEGFGLPALEAMACATPVIASRAASLPEVCGDGAAYVDDPLDVNEWMRAIESFADARLRDAVARRARERATMFSWQRCARETLDVLAATAEVR